MAIQSSTYDPESNWRACIKLLADARHAAQHETTTHGTAKHMAEYLASLPLIEVLPLLALLNTQRLSPAASCLTSTAKAGEQGRPAIGGNLTSESRPTS